MTKTKSAPLRRALLTWFDHHQRDLPWRHTKDPYAIWLSEVMLQQTQVETVIPYFTRFLARFPKVEDLAAAPLPDVLALWRGLGYYSRARNLHRAAQEICSRFSGQLPRSVEALRSLPSFGRYTTGAVASIAFGLPAPLVDGNVARVFARLFEVEGAPGDKAREAKLWALAEELVVGERPGDFNQSLMELGATVCRPAEPLCLLCPVGTHCGALARDRVRELPPPKVRAPRKALSLAVGVAEREGRFLLARRTEEGLFGGLWELPSVDGNEALEAGSRQRAFDAELGRKTRVGEDALATVRRILTHRDLTLTLYPLAVRGEPRTSPRYLEYLWATPAEAAERGMSTAMQKALDAVLGSQRFVQQVTDPGSKLPPRHQRTGK